ncbi:putative DNA primase/helicase [Nitrosomonas aestuarii]|uniref:Putative DNA primase/helicase n=1 Tax=Nitrosomonas aestuarii TaxID=52441 RepID=A0A1I4HF23_9PROT|nr:toprim domain-containing protein [Nitrosomonas aestuarii]SFL40805.1 putative DNA primase/helicase [Nitrosomonas aestuarii]
MSTIKNASGQAGAMNKRVCITDTLKYQSFDAEQQFKDAMQIAGIHYSGGVIPDGKLHRFHVEGQKRGSKNGAYVFHGDKYPAGWFQDYKNGISQTWRMDGSRCIPLAVQKQIEAERRQREAEQRKAHERAADKAAYIWRLTKPPVKHSYLAKKRIQPHGARLYRDALVIPIYNESDQLINLQFIDSQGNKRFLSGGRKRGCFYIIGDLAKRILICEGFATGVSLHEETVQRVVVAFDAGNLLPVARNVRELSPDSDIIICGDNDLSGVGQDKATEAALAVGGKVLIPPTPGQDWNDCLTGDIQ